METKRLFLPFFVSSLSIGEPKKEPNTRDRNN